MQNYFNQRGHNRINIIETVISGKDVEKPGNNKCVLAQSCLTLSHLVAQSCPTHCDLRDCSWPDSSVHGISQARILEWVATHPGRDLPNPGIKLRFPILEADSLSFEPLGMPPLTPTHIFKFSRMTEKVKFQSVCHQQNNIKIPPGLSLADKLLHKPK